MSGYSPIYNKVNDILQQQQQQSYSDLTREVNILQQQQQQQQSYSELARQVAMLPQHCYPDSGLCLLSQIISLETVSPHSDSTPSQSAKVCSFVRCSQNLFTSPLTFPQLKHIYICIPS